MERLLLDRTTYLTADCADDDDTIAVADDSEPAPSFRVRIDQEILLVTAVDGAAWSITRGLEGTAPAAHLAGAAVPNVLTPAGLDAIIANAIAALPAYTINAVRQGGAPPELTTASEETIIFPGKAGDPLDWYDEDTGIFRPGIPGWWLAMIELTLLNNSEDRTALLSVADADTTFLLATTAQFAEAGRHLYVQNTAVFYCDGEGQGVKITCYLDSAANAYIYPQAKATHMQLRFIGTSPAP